MTQQKDPIIIVLIKGVFELAKKCLEKISELPEKLEKVGRDYEVKKGVITKESPVETPVQEKPSPGSKPPERPKVDKVPKPEDLNEAVIALVNEHPQGISLPEIAEYFGKKPQAFTRRIGGLLADGKLRKEDKLYFPKK